MRARAVRDLQPESMVQDALEQSCHSMTFNTGLWPKVPQRVVGPAIEAELAAFLDVLQLPIRATPAEEEAARLEMEQSVAEDGKAPPAPLLVVLGGGGFSSEEVLLKKLELFIGLSRLAPYEKGGLQIMAAGELACCLLSGVLGISMGGPARDWAKGALQEALLDVLRTGVSLSLPLDLLCKVPEGDAESQDREVVPLAAAWKASQPIFLGFCDGRECYVSLDPEHGTLQLSQSASSPEEGPEAPEALEAEPEPAEPAEPADPEDPEAADGEPEAAEEAAKTFPAGVPENWTPKDIGPATLEQLRMLLRRSRGAVWNGSLGCCEDGFQEGTKDFLAMLDSRLTGAGEDEEDEEDEEEDDEEGDDEEGDDDEPAPDDDDSKPRKEAKPKERRAEFEMAAVLGRDSRRLLEGLLETPANAGGQNDAGQQTWLCGHCPNAFCGLRKKHAAPSYNLFLVSSMEKLACVNWHDLRRHG
ncbi:unnamed protein product [Effrenium voratum]|nr:unnamed protein product [Effrenium voratum]